jgi:hypothetical protein
LQHGKSVQTKVCSQKYVDKVCRQKFVRTKFPSKAETLAAKVRSKPNPPGLISKLYFQNYSFRKKILAAKAGSGTKGRQQKLAAEENPGMLAAKCARKAEMVVAFHYPMEYQAKLAW